MPRILKKASSYSDKLDLRRKESGQVEQSIFLTYDDDIEEEETYSLSVDVGTNCVQIEAGDRAGVHYGIQTLLSLLCM